MDAFNNHEEWELRNGQAEKMSSQSPEQPEHMSDFFDKRAAGYDEHMARSVVDFETFYRTVAEPIPKTIQKLKILDIGCGTGLELDAVFLNTPGAHITAIDLSQKMLEQLRKRHKEHLPQLKLIRGSYLDIELGENFFDFAVSVMTLHHLLPQRKQDVYEKIHRALKKGGVYIEGDYIVSCDKEKVLLSRYRERYAAMPVSQEGMHHIDIPLSIDTQRKLLFAAGFSAVDAIWQSEEAAVLAATRDDAK